MCYNKVKCMNVQFKHKSNHIISCCVFVFLSFDVVVSFCLTLFEMPFEKTTLRTCANTISNPKKQWKGLCHLILPNVFYTHLLFSLIHKNHCTKHSQKPRPHAVYRQKQGVGPEKDLTLIQFQQYNKHYVTYSKWCTFKLFHQTFTAASVPERDKTGLFTTAF